MLKSKKMNAKWKHVFMPVNFQKMLISFIFILFRTDQQQYLQILPYARDAVLPFLCPPSAAGTLGAPGVHYSGKEPEEKGNPIEPRSDLPQHIFRAVGAVPLLLPGGDKRDLQLVYERGRHDSVGGKFL